MLVIFRTCPIIIDIGLSVARILLECKKLFLFEISSSGLSLSLSHFQLAPWSRKRGSIYPLPYTLSWRNDYLINYRDNFTFHISFLSPFLKVHKLCLKIITLCFNIYDYPLNLVNSFQLQFLVTLRVSLSSRRNIMHRHTFKISCMRLNLFLYLNSDRWFLSCVAYTSCPILLSYPQKHIKTLTKRPFFQILTCMGLVASRAGKAKLSLQLE
jgi:hypothetical protein